MATPMPPSMVAPTWSGDRRQPEPDRRTPGRPSRRLRGHWPPNHRGVHRPLAWPMRSLRVSHALARWREGCRQHPVGGDQAAGLFVRPAGHGCGLPRPGCYGRARLDSARITSRPRLAWRRIRRGIGGSRATQYRHTRPAGCWQPKVHLFMRPPGRLGGGCAWSELRPAPLQVGRITSPYRQFGQTSVMVRTIGVVRA